MQKFLLFIFLTFLSQFSIAEDYYWKGSSGAGTIYTAPSPTSLCTTLSQTVVRPTGDPIEVVFKSPTTADCNFTYWGNDAHTFKLSFSRPMTRYGDSCPEGTINNTETYTCDQPPPECKEGDQFPSKGTTANVITSSNGSNYVSSQPKSACYNQCQYAPAPDVRPSSCYGQAGGQGWCNFILKGTGENCSADSYEIAQSGDQLNPSDTPSVPESDPTDPLCPSGWAVQGNTCFKEPPKVCDPSTGEVCPEDPDNPDGNGGGGNGGTGGGTGDGSTGEGAGSSSGSADALEDYKDANSPAEPEACKPKADGTGCGGPTVRGEECTKTIECTGDAIQCAILRQEKKMACAFEYEQARPFLESEVSKDAYQLQETEIDGSSLFSDGLNAPRWMPASCPAPKSITVKGVSTSLSFQPSCDFASAIGPLFVALASIFFAVYVGRGLGGN